MYVIRKIIAAIFVFILSIQTPANAQQYRYINGFTKEVNDNIESFLNSTLTKTGRKVAVFDCDGTLLGQSPYYLVDEALYGFAEKHYQGNNDKLSKDKMNIVKAIRKESKGKDRDKYKRSIIRFFEGMSTEEVADIGWQCYLEKYKYKMYPEMKELLANIKAYGIEIWVVTASPELLYQRIIKEELGIPEERIIGVRSRISNSIVTDDVIDPIPQQGGKSDAIQTFIKARPIICCGNSRGDKEMLLESAGLRIIVNPDDKKKQKDLNNKTFKNYWVNHANTVTVYCNDVSEQHDWIAHRFGIKANKDNPKYNK